MTTVPSTKLNFKTGFQSRFLAPSILVSALSLLNACGGANGVVLGSAAADPTDAATTDDSTSPSTANRDPAFKLTESQIISLYSNSSCDALTHDDGDAPIFDDDMTNGVNEGNLPDYQRGLRGKVYTPPLNFVSNDWLNLNRYSQPDALPLPNVLYFFNLDVPTRSFDKGFPLFDGSLLEGVNEQPLQEYFRINFDGYVELADTDAEGDYEIALISDDGATVDMGINNTRIISHPDDTPSMLMCATQTVSFKHGFSQPVNVNWFQGPRYHIALQMLWRKVGSGAEPLCGQAGNDLWFDYNAGPYVKKQAFKDLESRGWKVMTPKNFRLPTSEALNPCSSPRVQEVFSQHSS